MALASRKLPVRPKRTQNVAPRGGRREEVLSAALQCFNKHGVDNTSIEMICDASGASIGTVYHHFKSKDGIAEALYLEGRRLAQVFTRERLHKARSAKEGVRSLVMAFVDWVADNQEMARYVYGMAPQFSARPAVVTNNRSYYAEVGEWLGSFERDLRPLEASMRVAILYGPLHAYARLWIYGYVSKSPRAVVDDLVETAWRALRA